MLACVVCIPAIAISGSSWAHLLEKLQHMPGATLFLEGVQQTSQAICDRASCFFQASVPAGPLGTIETAAEATPPIERIRRDAPPPARMERSKQPEVAASSEFRRVGDRLQQLGATYYLLESWGSGEPLYRFSCRVAVVQSADYTHCFEATNPDPLKAMLLVLQQVEDWQIAVSRHG